MSDDGAPDGDRDGSGERGDSHSRTDRGAGGESDETGFDDAFDELADGSEDAGDGSPDPFEALDDGDVESPDAGPLDADPPDAEATGVETGAPIERSPFEELEAEAGETDLDAVFEEAFTDESVEDADVEALWEELESFEAESGGEHVEVVPKRSFCEGCQYLSEPPEFRCTHEGTEIMEFVDIDHVRVRECPVVAQRRGVEPE